MVCCVKTALHVNNLYCIARTQLENAQQECHAIKNTLYTCYEQYRCHVNSLQRQAESTQLELERERKVSEVANQQLLALEDRYIGLQREQQRTEQSAKDTLLVAQEVSRQVEGYQNGQGVGELILESAKNLQLVEAMSGHYTEEDTVTKLRYSMEQNVEIQQRNNQLYHQLMAMSQQVENGKDTITNLEKAMDNLAKNRDDEIANLKKALELTSADKQQKRPRRAKPKHPRVD
jgi:hypothetical protein